MAFVLLATTGFGAETPVTLVKAGVLIDGTWTSGRPQPSIVCVALMESEHEL